MSSYMTNDVRGATSPWISPRRVELAPTPDPGSLPLRSATLADLQRPAATPAASPSPSSLPRARAKSEKTILSCRVLFKGYRKGAIGVPVLQGVDLDVREGEFVAMIGPSGCGKSTLLHLLGTLDAPDAGEVHFQGHRIDNLPAAACDVLRNRHFGFIFQFYHLLPELTALENILAPALISESVFSYWRRRGAHRRRAAELLDLLGLSHRARHKPCELSGGEMQRAAIGRALLSRPKVLLADEPTGNLDRTAGEQIMTTLAELNERENLTIVMVTHDPWIAGQAHRTVRLSEGRVQS
mgnify:CR=1 FL=1